jgi:predicted SprT family Zn-dependent metalloprotease
MGQKMCGGTARLESKAGSILPLPLMDRIGQWFLLWQLAGFERHITVSFSSRLRRTLGRCYPKRRRISVARQLKDMDSSILEEVLCHECAHLTAFELHGENCRPHGPEWAELMRIAGYKPRRRLEMDKADSQHPRSRSQYIYVHSCPICQSQRLARRPVRSWRCTDCMALGLDGHLEIKRRPVQDEAAS